MYFRKYADIEVDNEVDISNIGDIATDFCKQSPVCNGYDIVSELDDVLKKRLI